jgi:putative transposase
MEKGKIYFFTATILDWIPILHDDVIKDIVINSLKFLVDKKALKLYAFVIMPNHIHLMIQPLENPEYNNVQLSFMRFTAQKIKLVLQDNKPQLLKKFMVNKQDRKFQIWQRNPLAIELYTSKVLEQKLNYIHNNPVQKKWMLSETAMDYKYSSIRFYELEDLHWPFLTHYNDDF